MKEEDEMIAEFLKTRGATKCPAKPAFVLGEIRTGVWRDAERKAEKRGGKKWEALQRRLAARGH